MSRRVNAGPFLASSGSELYVEDCGSGPAVLAIPGLGGGAWFFAGFARRLASGYRVLTCDLPGTGRSPSPALPHSTSDWVEVLGELIASRVDGPVVIVGHSFGTILALHAWQAWRARIRGIVFVGGLPAARPLMRERLTERARLVASAGLAGWGPRAAAGNFSRRTLEANPELVALFERLFETQAPERYVRWCELLLGASAAGVPATVDIPCLALAGEEDQYAPPDLVAQFAAGIRGGCPVGILDGCGHLPFLEAPDAFAAAVRSYLRTVC